MDDEKETKRNSTKEFLLNILIEFLIGLFFFILGKVTK